MVCADLQATPRPGVDGETVPTHELIRTRHGSDRATFLKTDVGDPHDVEACVKGAVEQGRGRLDMQGFLLLCGDFVESTVVWGLVVQ